ncbi:MAG: NADH-quinone oxidoreductase subunit H [Thermoplasmata archaeon]|nr:MAG: NADH-quinone oxidoreductase subunit H [Thermoplasmata archaeon]
MTGEFIFWLVIKSIIMAGVAIFFGLLYKGIDRKIVAHMQGRVGPPIRQPFLDVIKLMSKENIVPKHAIKWLFNAAPLICLASSIMLLLYIPIGGFDAILEGHGDLILILYLFAIPSIAMVAGGFASSSPYAAIGAQREVVTMISYELPLAVVIIAIAWKLSGIEGDVFSMAFIASHPIWQNVGILGLIGVIMLLISIIIVAPGELAKIPFDVAEAETEIAGGLTVEYSGRNLAMLYIADGVKIFAFASLVVALFFPYGIASLLSLSGIAATIADFLFFLLKVFLVMFFAVTLIRAGVARLRITQVVTAYWVTTTLIALLGLVLLMWDTHFNVRWL